MSETMESRARRERRVGIMADCRVGRAIVHHMLQFEPSALVALIVVDERNWQDVRLPEGCLRLTWATINTDLGRELLDSAKIDVLVLAWWPHLLKGELLRVAPIILNTHPSYLPHSRGKDPNFWAIVDCRPFGVTIHHVNASIDGGDIAFQKEIAISWEDTGGSLYERALEEMIALFADRLPAIVRGEIPKLAQNADCANLHFRRELEPASRLSLDEVMTTRDLLNRLRARTFRPHPACRFTDGDSEFEVRVEIKRLA